MLLQSGQVIAGTTIDVPRPRARSSVSYLSSARSFLFWFPIPLERGFLFLRFPILPNRFPIPLEGFPIYGFPISLEPPRMVSYLRYGVSYYSRAGFLFLRFPISHSFLFYAGRQYLYSTTGTRRSSTQVLVPATVPVPCTCTCTLLIVPYM